MSFSKRRTTVAAAASLVFAATTLPAFVHADGADAAYSWQTPSQPWQNGQIGFNNCIQRYGSYNQTGMCNTLAINSAEDFCLYAPPMNNTIANTERFTVAYCTQPGYGTRLIPDGTLTSVHFVKTPNYVQVVANGDFTKINIAPGDEGGELDPHGDDGNGNPEGTLVYSRAFGNDSHGNPKQMHQWMQFISYSQACFRACVNNDAYDSALCQHIYDKMGCGWVMPSNYTVGAFDNCEGDNGDPPGVYGTSTWYQGDCGAACAPPAHDPPASSNCQNIASPMNKVMLPGMTTSTTMSSMTTSASSTNPSSGSGSSSSSSSNHSGAVGQVGTSSLGATALVVAAAIGAGALLL